MSRFPQEYDDGYDGREAFERAWCDTEESLREREADDRPATMEEAEHEYVANVGPSHPDRAWILSDRDVWYPNPAYRGPPAPHPEEERPEPVECAWFALCTNEATGTTPHPILGEVPTCSRCHKFATGEER